MRKALLFILICCFIVGCSASKTTEPKWVPKPSYIQLTDGRYVQVASEEEFYAIPAELRGDVVYTPVYQPEPMQ